MEVINPRSALLSNFEVLTLLRELEDDHLSRTKTAQRIKKEESSENLKSSIAAGGKDPTVIEVSENLRTIEVEAIQYLSADYQPMSSQTPEGISKLVTALTPFELTKAEKLQVVNLAPTEPVELYVIVEELEDRLGDRMDEILTHVRSSLIAPTPTTNVQASTNTAEQAFIYVGEQWDTYVDADVHVHVDLEAAASANDIVFDDMGEGVGVEGDLDMDDD